MKNIFNFFKSGEKKERIPSEKKSVIKKRELFYNQLVKKGDLYFDVGANVGNRIEPMLNIGTKVVAVEPQESCIKILKAKFGETIEIVPMGLGEVEDVKDFYIANANTISSFSTDWIESVKKDRFKEYTWDKPVKIQITTLDKLIEKYGVPAFIKVDVEGYELEVLKGLTQPVKMISFEYTVPEQTQKVIDCIDQVLKSNPNAECNYSVGESMKFVSPNWQSADNMKKFVSSDEFIATDFGDIYVRSKS